LRRGLSSGQPLEDLFAVLVNNVDLIDVGIVNFSAAVHNVLFSVPGVHSVQADVTEEPVRTGISVYLVVTFSAKHHVIAIAAAEHVSGLLTEDVVVASFSVDCVILLCAYEVVRLVGAEAVHRVLRRWLREAAFRPRPAQPRVSVARLTDR
jgi:hypothetical protein